MTITRRIFVKSAATAGAALAAAGLLSACAADDPTADSADARADETGTETGSSGEAEMDARPTESAAAADSTSEAANSSEASADETAGAEVAVAGPALVVYYSTTGNTERIAEMIARDTKAALFALEPVDPYTSEDTNWRDENSRVSQEMPRRSEVDVELVQVTPPDWGSYKTVFVGYPIWWQSFSWVLNDFVRNNNFDGKTIVPFCTSSSSPLGDSDAALAAEANGGNWLPGERFTSGTSEEEVRTWLESLPLQ